MFNSIKSLIDALFGVCPVPDLFIVIVAFIFIYGAIIRNLLRLITTKSFIKYADTIITIGLSIYAFMSLGGVLNA